MSDTSKKIKDSGINDFKGKMAKNTNFETGKKGLKREENNLFLFFTFLSI